MADQKIFPLIPESLQEQLLDEAKEILDSRDKNKAANQVKANHDAVVAFAKQKNEDSKTKK